MKAWLERQKTALTYWWHGSTRELDLLLLALVVVSGVIVASLRQVAAPAGAATCPSSGPGISCYLIPEGRLYTYKRGITFVPGAPPLEVRP